MTNAGSEFQTDGTAHRKERRLDHTLTVMITLTLLLNSQCVTCDEMTFFDQLTSTSPPPHNLLYRNIVTMVTRQFLPTQQLAVGQVSDWSIRQNVI